jgi:nitrate/nitrite transport system ATP-binding protein
MVNIIEEIYADQPQIVSKETAIEVKNVSISFKTNGKLLTAVKDIDLDIKKGEIISIIGHSGCGKSTLMNTISGMVKPSKGEVYVNGNLVTGPGPDRGIVFQNYSLLPWLNVFNNVYEAVDATLPKLSTNDKKSLTERTLNMVNLDQHKDKLPSQLSGGMKQRTAIARAFAINPSVLLLDEPFGALDALTKSNLHIELLKLWNLDNRDKTIVMVTHDIEEAIFLSDRVVVLNDGPESTIKEIVTVNLARPRNKKEIIHLPEYQNIHDRLLSLLIKNLSINDVLN